MKLCECGCGQPAPIARQNNKRYGWIKGQPLRFIKNHHFRGARNVNFNHGLCFDKTQGRWFIHVRDRSYVAYARAVMECHLQRPLLPTEVIHHLNRDRTDDHIENLCLKTSNSSHMREHTRYSDEDLIQTLKNLAAQLGRIPMTSDIENDSHMPSRATYLLRFGSLPNARRKAGLVA